jgi:hypothetical protein
MTSEIKVDTISEQTSANGVTIDGLTIKDGNIIGDVALAGTTPTFTIGDGGAEDAALIFDGNALDFYIALDDSADDLVIGTGTTIGSNAKFTIENEGNVKITRDDNVFLSIDSTQSNGDEWHIFNAVSGTTSQLQFKNIDQSAVVMLLDETGKVGINEVSPTSQLHITGATDAGGTISLKRPNTTVTAGQTLGAIEFITADSGSAGTAARILGEADGTGGQAKLVFNTGTGGSNTTRMIINSDGDIGMSATPNNVDSGRTLHIKGHNSDGANIRLESTGDTADTDDMVIQKNDTVGFIKLFGGDTFKVFTSNAERLAIDADGVVSITTSGNGDNLSLISTDADGNIGPNLRLYRNSASPDDNNDLGTIDFEGRNDNSQDVQYGMIRAILKDASDGTEDGTLEFHHMKNGSLSPSLQITPDECVINESSNDYDFRVESNSNTHMLFVDGGNNHVNIGTSTDLGGTLNVEGQAFFRTADNSNTITLISTDADAESGPRLSFQRQSSSPADADVLGQIYFTGKDSGGNNTDYATIISQANDVTDGTEDGILSLQTMVAGTSREHVRMSNEGTCFNELSQSLDFRIESNGNANMIFINGANDYVGIGTTDSNSAVCNVSGATTSNQILVADATSSSYGGDGVQRIFCARSNTTAYGFLQAFSSAGSDVEFLLRGDGALFADGAYDGSGADYAEYFEWKDGNSSSEDRRGYSVVLDGNKIVKATDSDDVSKIIGVISANPTVVGDSAYTKWNDKYLKDDFGAYIREEYTVTEWSEGGDKEEKHHSYETDKIPSDVTVPDNATVITTEEDGATKLTRRKINPSYDSTKKYVSRENRKEWDTVGLMGKLRLKKGEPTGTNWIKMRDISDTVEEWLVR